MRRISWLIRTFSVSMLVVAAVQSLATRRTGTLSEEELRQILGADHLKASVGVSRNCDQVNRDLVNQYGAGSEVRPGRGYIAGSDCSASPVNSRCLSCQGTAAYGPSPQDQVVVASPYYGNESFGESQDYNCRSMTIGICTTVNGYAECTDDGTTGGDPLGCAVIHYWLNQTQQIPL